jgi:two-component system, LytTR family, sensor histidine kinase AlgZ
MHPIFRSRSTVLAYFVAWIPLFVMFRFLLAYAGHLHPLESIAVTVPVIAITAFACLWPWYSCRILQLGKSPLSWLVVGHLIVAMLVSMAVVGIVHVILIGLNHVFADLEERVRGAMPVLTGMVCLTYLLSVALHYVVQAVEQSRQAEILSREAQIKALKAQVNPHFLFNSLNSISALTSVNPSKAREMCVRLSDFLRNSLRLGERVSIPFEEELALMTTYLEVERIRFGGRLRVVQNVDAKCNQARDCDAH